MYNNYAEGHGGGIFVSADCSINLANSTIVDNLVGEEDVFGAGIYSDGGSVNLVNSIVYYNKREGDDSINYNLNGYSGDNLDEYSVIYSDVEGDVNWIPEGDGNISLDPLFASIQSPNFYLQEGSPCIDAGTTDLNQDGIVDIFTYNGSAPDMGAFEWNAEQEFGDLNTDGVLDVSDIVIMVDIVFTSSYEFIADMNVDGIVNIIDIIALVNIILYN